MANSAFTVSLSLLVAGGAIAGGYYLSKRQKLAQKQTREIPADMWEIPLAKVSSLSLDDYLQQHQKTTRDYDAVRVKGCPPRAPQQAAPLIEAVVDYRNCSGIGLLPKP